MTINHNIALIWFNSNTLVCFQDYLQTINCFLIVKMTRQICDSPLLLYFNLNTYLLFTAMFETEMYLEKITQYPKYLGFVFW